MKSETRGVCGKCGEDYQPYINLFKADPLNLSSYARISEEYGWVCEDCRADLMDTENYATSKIED